MKKLILLALGLSLIVLMVRHVGLSRILAAVSEADGRFLAASAFVYSLSFVCRSRKWFLLLARVNPVPCSSIRFFPVYMVVALLSNFTPAKTGEAYAPVLFHKYYGTTHGSGYSIILLDRMMEVAVLILGMVAAVIYFFRAIPARSADFHLILSAGVLFIIALCAATMLIVLRPLSTRFICWGKNRFQSKTARKLINRLEIEVQHFYHGITAVGSKTLYRQIIPLTLLAWCCDIVNLFLLLRAVARVDLLDVAMAVFLNVGASLASFLPLGIGASEVSCFYWLSLKGYQPGALTAGILLSRIIPLALLLIYGLGAYYLLRYRYKTYEKISAD